jgi:hypothetical protein
VSGITQADARRVLGENEAAGRGRNSLLTQAARVLASAMMLGRIYRNVLRVSKALGVN